MKSRSLILALIFVIFSSAAFSQEKKADTLQIKTSAVCNMCKRTIEAALYDLKGVKSAELDVATKIVTVVYKPSAITPDEIRKAITLAGYDADDMPADTAAYEKLPGCCKRDAKH